MYVCEKSDQRLNRLDTGDNNVVINKSPVTVTVTVTVDSYIDLTPPRGGEGLGNSELEGSLSCGGSLNKVDLTVGIRECHSEDRDFLELIDYPRPLPNLLSSGMAHSGFEVKRF